MPLSGPLSRRGFVRQVGPPGGCHPLRVVGFGAQLLGKPDQRQCPPWIVLYQGKLETEIGLSAVVFGTRHVTHLFLARVFWCGGTYGISIRFRANQKDIRLWLPSNAWSIRSSHA